MMRNGILQPQGKLVGIHI